MATLADNVIALQTAVAALTAKVDALAIPQPEPVDFTPVLSAVANVQSAVDEVRAEVKPTA